MHVTDRQFAFICGIRALTDDSQRRCHGATDLKLLPSSSRSMRSACPKDANRVSLTSCCAPIAAPAGTAGRQTGPATAALTEAGP